MAWLYVPGLEGSSLPFTSSATTTEPWVTSSGKATQRPLSWPGWKRRPWIKLLFGTISRPSTADRGAELWIASLRATHASRSATPESAVEKTILDTFGRIADGLLLRSLRASSFSKTSKGTLPLGLTLSEPSYEHWVIELRRASLVRRKLAHRMNAFDSSRSAWLTPATTDVHGIRELDGKRSGGLNTQAVSSWATPQAHDALSPRAPENRADRPGHRNLNDEATSWQTPSATDGKRGDYTLEHGDPERPQISLQGQARSMWPTPDARLSNDGEDPKTWLERKQHHAAKEENATRAGMPLAIAAVMYPTPAARDAKGANSSDHVTTNGTGAMHMDQLPNFVEHSLPDFSRPGLTNTTNGSESLSTTRRLNPRFVEWLMAWPIGWTDCDVPETAFTQYKRRWRSYLFGRSF